MFVKKAPRIPLPKSWTSHVRWAMLHVISLAQYATVYTRSWAVDSLNGRVRLKAEIDRLQQEIGLLVRSYGVNRVLLSLSGHTLLFVLGQPLNGQVP